MTFPRSGTGSSCSSNPTTEPHLLRRDKSSAALPSPETSTPLSSTSASVPKNSCSCHGDTEGSSLISCAASFIPHATGRSLGRGRHHLHRRRAPPVSLKPHERAPNPASAALASDVGWTHSGANTAELPAAWARRWNGESIYHVHPAPRPCPWLRHSIRRQRLPCRSRRCLICPPRNVQWARCLATCDPPSLRRPRSRASHEAS